MVNYNEELTKLVNIHSDKTNHLLWLLELDVLNMSDEEHEKYIVKLNAAMTEKKEATNNIINFLKTENED